MGTGVVSHYECFGCKKAKRDNPDQYRDNSVPVIAIENETKHYVDDPLQPRNDHFCQPLELSTVYAEQYDRNARNSVRRSGIRPRRAYRDMRASVARDFPNDHNVRDSVLGRLKSFGKVRSGYYKAYASNYPTINDINSIPDYLLKTYKGILINTLHIRIRYTKQFKVDIRRIKMIPISTPVGPPWFELNRRLLF